MDKDTTDVEKGRVWLSDLPNEILLHILSFLPTKPLVATSVLSRRWQYLWAFTPNLHLDRSMFRYKDRNQFINFAERVFVLRNGSSLVSFSLSSGVYYNYASRDINALIRSAMQCNVEQLSLSLYDDEYDRSTFLFPCYIFRCQSLVKLSLLLAWIDIRVPSVVSLPNLKHLELKCIKFVDDKSTEKLLSHPLLEELIISKCDWIVTTVNVNSPKLRILAIDDGYSNWPSDERRVCFIGDNLKIFRYTGCVPFQYCICGSTMQLREAELAEGIRTIQCLEDEDIPSRPEDLDGAFKRYCKLLNSLSSVQNLTLEEHDVTDGFTEHVFGHSPELTFPVVFEHVTRLNITSSRKICINSERSMMIFERCPHLEHLNFMKALDCLPVESSPVLSPIPSCFNTHLKKITVHCYGSEDFHDQNDAINILLCSAPLLEEMVLYWHLEHYILSSDDSSWVEEVEREFNKRPKVSENCRVSIVVLV